MATYTPPQSVADNAQQALDKRQAKPPSQRGMTAVGLARARQLANKQPVSLETIQRMVSFFARHEVDKQGSTWDSYGPGRQAWNGWGGDEGRQWAISILQEVSNMEVKAGSRHSADDMKIIRAARKASQSIAGYMQQLGDDGDDETKMHDADMSDEYNTRQRMMASSLVEVTHEAGKFDMSAGPNGAHYMAAANNPFMEKGLCCKHCYFYQPEYNCAIVAGVIDPMGLCKLWVIPQALIVEDEPAVDMYAVVMADDDDDDEIMAVKLTDEERDALPDDAFVLRNERKFPIVTAEDVYDAWLTWHNYRGNVSFETFKENLTALAVDKGQNFVARLPQKWQDEMAEAAKANTRAYARKMIGL